ncbi:class II glutamine amidotransferase [Acetohalobium arabaticum]|uniref:Glutamate synthase (NADPH) GltB1 subunit n=1 Tax=Acetohalobium arabaticum (strain ATCC 49924 / DSM 5501 / Z-7288) TaxID=574087 RepID=D9QS41_ACEAZ|nr:glutamine amidotransferase family protein [Acetohalobium arabaticum]ADL13332.1 glutamate synthase (NADPH) GltB1 subunit [Acetohalobium arabaticum DSM 5501]
MRGSRPQEKIMSGCAISGILNRKGNRFSGAEIMESIALMHERSNGLGGGFAAYGIYPEYEDKYAVHMFYDDLTAKEEADHFLNRHFSITISEKIPTREVEVINNPPIIWRYFVEPDQQKLTSAGLTEDEYVAQCVMNINANYRGAFVVSSGKNMGVFKGVGYPEDIGEFYQLEEYKAYLWTAHGRFPTNTPGWWGGAHPFTLLDWSIVHNGEISSYGANKRYLEMFGYECAMQTDTEAITYLFDLMLRKHDLPLEAAVKAVAAPLWSEIERMDEKEAKIAKTIRTVYSSALLNGPFSVILGHKDGFIALNDRIKLRPLVVAKDDERTYVASEESAIRQICSNPKEIRTPKGGEAVIGLLEGRQGV